MTVVDFIIIGGASLASLLLGSLALALGERVGRGAL